MKYYKYDYLEDFMRGIVLAGGSGPVCSALVNFGYIFDELKKKKLKRL